MSSGRRGKVLKAGGIFLLSMGMATALGLGFSALSPEDQCDFSVLMSLEQEEEGIRAVVTSVDGEFHIGEVEYRVVVLRESASHVISEGNLTSALTAVEGVVYVPQDPANGLLQAGDYLVVDEAEEGTHVLLVTREGTPLGWTGGCES